MTARSCACALALVYLARFPASHLPPHAARVAPPATFADDVAFLKQHTQVVVLGDGPGARIVVAPAYQGRVMTSTADGSGVVRLDRARRGRQRHASAAHERVRRRGSLLARPRRRPVRALLQAGRSFDLEHWQTPEPFDWGAWDVVAPVGDRGGIRASSMSLVNHSGTPFYIDVAAHACACWSTPTSPTALG